MLGTVEQKTDEKRERTKNICQVFGMCDTMLGKFTKHEATSKLSKIKTGKTFPISLFAKPYASLFKKISLLKAEELANSVISLSDGPKSKKEVQEVVDKFHLDLVKDYSEKLTDPGQALETLKEQYSKANLQMQKNYYETLRKLKWEVSSPEISGTLTSDSFNKPDQQPTFPILDFYVLLLTRYDKERPSGILGEGLEDKFKTIMQMFLKISHYLALKSNTFEGFDAKMKALESFEPPVVKQ